MFSSCCDCLLHVLSCGEQAMFLSLKDIQDPVSLVTVLAVGKLDALLYELDFHPCCVSAATLSLETVMLLLVFLIQ